MVVYLGFFYVFLGILILLMPLIYIEFGRPKDLIKAGLNLTVGMILIIKNSFFDDLYSLVLIFVTALIIFYILEIVFMRWNQLSDKEKNKLKTLEEFKKNLSIFLEAIYFVLRKFLNLIKILKFDENNENLIKKKYLRNGENGKI